MVEESQAAQAVDVQALLRLHRANYGVMRAGSIEELHKAIEAVLRSSTFICAYYARELQNLRLITAFDPKTGTAPMGIPFQCEVSAAPAGVQQAAGNIIVRKVSADSILFTDQGASELKYGTNLLDIKIPETVTDGLRKLGCDRIAVIPVGQGADTTGLFFVGAQSDQLFDSTAVEPLASLADLLPPALVRINMSTALAARARELDSIATLGESTTAITDLTALCAAVHQSVRESFGDVAFMIALLEPESDRVRVPYAFEAGRAIAVDPFRTGDNLVSVVIGTRKPLLLNQDVEDQTRALGISAPEPPRLAEVSRIAPSRIGFRSAKSWLGCPLAVGGVVIGAMVLQDFEREQRFNPEDVRLLMSLAGQLAGALYTIRLLDTAHQHTLQFETAAGILREVGDPLLADELVRRSIQLICDRFAVDFAAVYLVEGDQAIVREATGDAGSQLKASGYSQRVGSDSAVGRVTSGSNALIVDEGGEAPAGDRAYLAPGMHTELALPLRVGERVIGALDLQSGQTLGLNALDLPTLQLLADQLALGIANATLAEKAQDRLSQHRLLHHITTAAASSTTIEEALNSTVQGLQVTLGGDQISILLVDREHKMLEVRAAIGYPNQDVNALRIPIDSGITGWVATHRQSLRLGDVTKDPRYMAISERVRSEVAVPLIYRNEVLGVLNVESIRAGAYDESDEDMLASLGGSLAAIIAHSRLLGEFRQQAERQRLLYEVTNRIRRSTNIQTILATTANEINKVIGARSARIKIDLGSESGEIRPDAD